MGETFVYKEDQALAAASHITLHANANLIGDYYIGISSLFYYDPYRIYVIRNETREVEVARESIFFIHNRYYEGRIRFYSETPVVQFMNKSMLNRIYDNYGVTGWRSEEIEG